MIIIIATDFLTLRGGNANLESSMRILWFSCHCLPAHSPAIVRWSKEPCSGGQVFTVILHALLSMQLTLVQLSKFWKASLQVSKLREAHAWKWKLTTPVFPDTRQVHAGRFFAIQRAKERRKCPHIFHGNLGFSFGYWYLPRMNLTQHLSSRHGPVRGTAHCSSVMSGSGLVHQHETCQISRNSASTCQQRHPKPLWLCLACCEWDHQHIVVLRRLSTLYRLNSWHKVQEVNKPQSPKALKFACWSCLVPSCFPL